MYQHQSWPFVSLTDQDFDQSIVIFRLDLKPGDVVIESGTGSGVMSSVSLRPSCMWCVVYARRYMTRGID